MRGLTIALTGVGSAGVRVERFVMCITLDYFREPIEILFKLPGPFSEGISVRVQQPIPLQNRLLDKTDEKCMDIVS